MTTPSFYTVLGVRQTATADEIKAAFHRRAPICHPDVPGTGDRQSFEQLLDAREVLLDPRRRRLYDAAIVTAEISGQDLSLANRILAGPRDRSIRTLTDYLKDVQAGATISGNTIADIVERVRQAKRLLFGS